MSDFPNAKLHILELDLSDLNSIRKMVELVKKEFDKIDILVNNAGLMAIPFSKTKDGFEMQFGVNHLGHFALNALLFDHIKQSTDPRIVVVSSSAHKMSDWAFGDINSGKKYNSWKAYGRSKLANLLYTYELAERVNSANSHVKVLAAHPGYADSSLMEKGPQIRGRNFMLGPVRLVNKLVAQSTEMGALPILYAATSEDVNSKDYFGPRGLFGLWGYPTKVSPAVKKISKKVQVDLWELSEELTGVGFLS